MTVTSRKGYSSAFWFRRQHITEQITRCIKMLTHYESNDIFWFELVGFSVKLTCFHRRSGNYLPKKRYNRIYEMRSLLTMNILLVLLCDICSVESALPDKFDWTAEGSYSSLAPPDQFDWTAGGSYSAFGTVEYFVTYPAYVTPPQLIMLACLLIPPIKSFLFKRQDMLVEHNG